MKSPDNVTISSLWHYHNSPPQRCHNIPEALYHLFWRSYEDENNLGQFVGEVRTVFKSELDKQVTKEVRAEKDNKVRDVDAKSHNGDAEDDDEDQEGGDKVGGGH